jgi:hypothetical protein
MKPFQLCGAGWAVCCGLGRGFSWVERALSLGGSAGGQGSFMAGAAGWSAGLQLGGAGFSGPLLQQGFRWVERVGLCAAGWGVDLSAVGWVERGFQCLRSGRHERGFDWRSEPLSRRPA